MQQKNIFTLAMLLIPLSGLGVDLYAPSLPAISVYMHTSHSLAKFSMSAYIIGFGISQCVSGIASDSVGRKPVLVIGLTVFLFSSILATFTDRITWLIVLRILQGLGAATASVNAKTILSDTYTGKTLQTASSYLVIFWALGPIVAPVIGGYLQHHFNWQANFLFYSAYSLLLLSLVVFNTKETHHAHLSLSPATIKKNINMIFSDRKFISGVLVYGLNYATFVLFAMMATFLIQDQLKLHATDFGHVALAIGVCFFIGTLLSRWLMHHLPTERIMAIGCFGMLATAAISVTLAQTIALSLFSIALPSIVLIFFSGVMTPSLLSSLLSFYPKIAGLAATIYGTILSLITFIITSILSFIAITSLLDMMLCYLVTTTMITSIYWFGWRAAPEIKK